MLWMEETLTEPQKPVAGLTEGLERQQAKKLFLDTKREREDHKRSLEVYKTYQENIKTSSHDGEERDIKPALFLGRRSKLCSRSKCRLRKNVK